MPPSDEDEVLFLGTGTSVGVPMIGCDCAVCVSTDPRNRRLRTSLYVRAARQAILIDAAPDLREQALIHRLRHVDAVLLTHAHADHIFGLDDLRRFNTLQQCAIPVHAHPATLRDVRRIFGYAEAGRIPRSGEYRPQIFFTEISGPFNLGPVRVRRVDVEHGNTPTVGYRLDWDERSLGYVPDCHAMSDAAVDAFRGVQVMILDGLRHRPHATHMTVAQSIACLQQIGAPRSYLVHICHDLEHEHEQSRLPPGIALSQDGLRLGWPQ